MRDTDQHIDRTTLDQEILDLLLGVIDSFKGHFVEALESLEMPATQGRLLMSLHAPTPMHELARSMGFDASHITAIVDCLEERGLVARTPDAGDRRIKRITLTDQGTVVREQIRQQLLITLPPLANLTRAQRIQLRDLLAAATAQP